MNPTEEKLIPYVRKRKPEVSAGFANLPISRVAGWTAHVYEQYSDNRLIRPESEYIGPMDVSYVPIAERG